MNNLVIIITILLTCYSCSKSKTNKKSNAVKSIGTKSSPLKTKKKEVLVNSNNIKELRPNAKNIYLTKCVSCHGVHGEGNKEKNAPRIGGQYDWYIKSQIKEIKSNKRSNGNTKKMLPFVKSLTDEEINSLSKYISLLSIN